MFKRILQAIKNIKDAKEGYYLEGYEEALDNVNIYGPKIYKCPVCGKFVRIKQGYICEFCGWEMEVEGTKKYKCTGENPVSLGMYRIIYYFFH